MATPPPTNANRGNPNVWTTYRGGVMQMTLTSGVNATSPNVMRTTMNQVQFCGDMTLPDSYTVPYVFAKLPSPVTPSNVQYLVVPCTFSNSSFSIVIVAITTEGELTLTGDYFVGSKSTLALDANAVPHTLHLDSVSFDLASGIYGGYNPS